MFVKQTFNMYSYGFKKFNEYWSEIIYLGLK